MEYAASRQRSALSWGGGFCGMIVSFVKPAAGPSSNACRHLPSVQRLLLSLLYLSLLSGVVTNGSANDRRLGQGAVPQASVESRHIRLPIIDGANIRFARFYTIEGPSKSNAGPFVQDDQGFVWFGTPYGLNRFDGYNFKVFTHDPGNPKSISGSFITALFKDRVSDSRLCSLGKCTTCINAIHPLTPSLRRN